MKRIDFSSQKTMDMSGSDFAVMEEEVPERPSTFQLAQLAATLATRPDSGKIPPADVVLEAMQLWEAAAKLNLVEKQQREMWAALYTDEKAEWEHRLKSYVGDKFVLYELLSEPRFTMESEVLPNLFPDAEETAESRREKFAELIHYAQEHQFFSAAPTPLHPDLKNIELHEGAKQLQSSASGEELLEGKFNALAVRMLVEAQQEKTTEVEQVPT